MLRAKFLDYLTHMHLVYLIFSFLFCFIFHMCYYKCYLVIRMHFFTYTPRTHIHGNQWWFLQTMAITDWNSISKVCRLRFSSMSSCLAAVAAPSSTEICCCREALWSIRVRKVSVKRWWSIESTLNICMALAVPSRQTMLQHPCGSAQPTAHTLHACCSTEWLGSLQGLHSSPRSPFLLLHSAELLFPGKGIRINTFWQRFPLLYAIKSGFEESYQIPGGATL